MRRAISCLFCLAIGSACSSGSDAPATAPPGGQGGDSGSAGTGPAAGTGGTEPDAAAGTGGTGGAGGTAGSADAGGPDGSIGDAGGDADAGIPSWTGPATRNSAGVLTNRPEAEFATSGALIITTAYFKLVTITPAFTTISVWGDFENRGTATLCSPLGDMSIDGIELTVTTSAPAYDSPTSSLSRECVEPGGKGAYRGIKNEVPATLLDAPNAVAYSITAVDPLEKVVRHPDEPVLLRPVIGPVERGWGVSATLQTTANPINNFTIDLFARDVSGLLFDDDPSFLENLGTLPVSAQLRFQSDPVENGIGTFIDGPFAGFEYFTSFIEGAKAAVQGGEDAALIERRARAADRRAAVMAACIARDAQRNSISSK
jgi:hypothetical protein